MSASILEQYRIHDFLRWHTEGDLVLNPRFQRRSVWAPQAKVQLIDTILRGLPMPKVYMRTDINRQTHRSIREVVDGQQRLRAITEFSEGRFKLTKRAKEFAGLDYAALSETQQDQFLTYPIAVDQLINASDDDVFDIFARLNTYTVMLNPAERRHGKYQGDFKWAVHESARSWRVLWDDLGVVTGRARLRMGDDALMAEMYGVLLQGVTDGGAPKIEAMYRKYDAAFQDEMSTADRLAKVLDFMISQFGELVKLTAFKRPPQFLIFFAACASLSVGIPRGDLSPAVLMPEGEQLGARSLDSLTELAAALEVSLDEDGEEMDVPEQFRDFVDVSKQSTQRIASRQVRFRYFADALLAN